MNEDVELLKRLVSTNIRGYVLNLVLDYGSFYLIGIDKKDRKKDEFTIDSYYKVDKKTKKLSEYSPLHDQKKFKELMKKPVYLRNKS